ncbi:MAG: hypothetical protein HQK88_15435 [Nitrospirae bacterium]|nr:hypothetical protein [Nitrospirota bacterium]MBF0536183.1 hypothetical protein [Nitrospirota bacterium]MBF0618193.1 hypothetical protein [Nitrospirota bacterium]
MVFMRNVTLLFMAAAIAVVCCANTSLYASEDSGGFLQSIENPTSSGQDSRPEAVSKDNKCEVAPQVNFIDTSSFDEEFSAALKKKCDNVTVKFLTPTQTNKIPGRLDKWFSRVVKYGGTVKAEIDPEVDEGRSIFGIIFDFISTIAAEIKENALYGPVENYNAIIFYQKSTGDITRVFFKHK